MRQCKKPNHADANGFGHAQHGKQRRRTLSMESTGDKLRAFFFALLVHLAVLAIALIGMFWTESTRPVTLPGPIIEAELVGVAQAPKPHAANKSRPTPPAPVTPPEPVKPPTPETVDAAPPPKPSPPKPTPEEIKRDQAAQAEILRQDQKNQDRVAEIAREKAEKADKAEAERKRQEQILLEQQQQEEQAKREQAIQKELDAVKKKREVAEKKLKLEQEKQKQLADANAKPAAKPPAAAQRAPAAEVPEADKAQTGMNGTDASLLGEYSAAIQNAVTLSWLRPDNATTGLRCRIHITQIPGGEVLSANVTGPCNADAVTRNSIEQAVKRAAPLPYKGYEKVFQRDLDLNFRYDG